MALSPLTSVPIWQTMKERIGTTRRIMKKRKDQPSLGETGMAEGEKTLKDQGERMLMDHEEDQTTMTKKLPSGFQSLTSPGKSQ